MHHFRNFASLLRDPLKVLLNQTIIFLLVKHFTDVFRAKAICFRKSLINLDTFQFLWFFLLLFSDCDFTKDFIMFKGDANKGLISSPIIIYEINGFNLVVS